MWGPAFFLPFTGGGLLCRPLRGVWPDSDLLLQLADISGQFPMFVFDALRAQLCVLALALQAVKPFLGKVNVEVFLPFLLGHGPQSGFLRRPELDDPPEFLLNDAAFYLN